MLLHIPAPDTAFTLTLFITVTATIYLGLLILSGIVGREEWAQVKQMIPHREREHQPL